VVSRGQWRHLHVNTSSLTERLLRWLSGRSSEAGIASRGSSVELCTNVVKLVGATSTDGFLVLYAPTSLDWHIAMALSVCLSVCFLWLCLSVYLWLSVCLFFVAVSVCLSVAVCLSVFCGCVCLSICGCLLSVFLVWLYLSVCVCLHAIVNYLQLLWGNYQKHETVKS